MTRYDWVTLGLNLFSAIILPITLWVIRALVRQAQAIRLNELRHIEDRLVRLEAKMDQHLQFHVERP